MLVTLRTTLAQLLTPFSPSHCVCTQLSPTFLLAHLCIRVSFRSCVCNGCGLWHMVVVFLSRVNSIVHTYGGTRTHIVCYICCLSVSCDHHNYDNCILAVWTSLHNYLHHVWREALVSLLVIIINCVCGSSWMERNRLGYFDCITWSAVADRIFVRMGLTCCR